jgi:hypothetical protein
MKKMLLIAGFLFSITNALAQTETLLAEFWVESFSYGKDTVRLKPSLLITVKGNSCSQIISIGKVGNTEFGMQVEVLQSKLGNVPHFIVGKAYFIKQAGKWRNMYEGGHENITESMASARKARGHEEIGIGGAMFDDPEFSIDYKDRFTIK